MKPEKSNPICPPSNQGTLYPTQEYLSMKKISQIIGKEINHHINSQARQAHQENKSSTAVTGCPYCCDSSKKLQVLKMKLKFVLKEISTLRQGFSQLSEYIEVLSDNFSFVIELVQQNINREAEKFTGILHSTEKQHRQIYKNQNLKTMMENKKLLEKNRQLQRQIQNLHLSTNSILQEKARLTSQLKELTQNTTKSISRTPADAINKNYDDPRRNIFTMKKYKTFDEKCLPSRENSFNTLTQRINNLKQMLKIQKECLSDEYMNGY